MKRDHALLQLTVLGALLLFPFAGCSASLSSSVRYERCMWLSGGILPTGQPGVIQACQVFDPEVEAKAKK